LFGARGRKHSLDPGGRGEKKGEKKKKKGGLSASAPGQTKWPSLLAEKLLNGRPKERFPLKPHVMPGEEVRGRNAPGVTSAIKQRTASIGVGTGFFPNGGKVYTIKRKGTQVKWEGSGLETQGKSEGKLLKPGKVAQLSVYW